MSIATVPLQNRILGGQELIARTIPGEWTAQSSVSETPFSVIVGLETSQGHKLLAPQRRPANRTYESFSEQDTEEVALNLGEERSTRLVR